MSSLVVNKLTQKNTSIYLLTIVASLLLSIWATSRSIVNPDGVCYLLSAEEMSRTTWNAAIHLCAQSHWPFFSWLINSITTITPLSYLHSAYVLDALFTASSTFFFMLIVKALGGDKKIMLLAAGVILMSHEFNAVREYIVRDHGFWAFYLASVWFFTLYYQNPKLKLALAWYLSLAIAALFRIESVVFLVLLPFTVWSFTTLTWKKRAQLCLQLCLPSIVLLLGILIYASYSQHALAKLGRLSEVANQLQHGFTMIAERYHTASKQLAEHVLTKDSAPHANFILIIMMISWYLASVVVNLSFGYSLLLAYAWAKRLPSVTIANWKPIIAYTVINVLVTSCFLFERFFLSKRYLIALSLMLMLWVPFALYDLMQRRGQFGKKIFLGISLLFITSSALSGIIDLGYSKNYIEDAGKWLAETVPAHANLYVNDYQLMYYSRHYSAQDLYQKLPKFTRLETISQDKWKQYDYLAVRLTKKKLAKDKTILQSLPDKPIKTFQNSRGDRVLIYQTAVNHYE